MEYLYFLIALIIVFLITKSYYFEKGFEVGCKENSIRIGHSIKNFADWFNKDIHPPMVGNTIFEIGCQIIRYNSISYDGIRNFVEKEGNLRYHTERISKYTNTKP